MEEITPQQARRILQVVVYTKEYIGGSAYAEWFDLLRCVFDPSRRLGDGQAFMSLIDALAKIPDMPVRVPQYDQFNKKITFCFPVIDDFPVREEYVTYALPDEVMDYLKDGFILFPKSYTIQVRFEKSAKISQQHYTTFVSLEDSFIKLQIR